MVMKILCNNGKATWKHLYSSDEFLGGYSKRKWRHEGREFYVDIGV
jgi:hypothetical protein